MHPMSAIGTKQTSACALHMSAFDPKRTWPAPDAPFFSGGSAATWPFAARATTSCDTDLNCLSNKL